MHEQQHPDTEQLDRLRAGLLDERPEEKAALEQHLAGCADCRARLDSWQQLAPGALGPETDPASLQRDLQAAREQALAAANVPQRRPLLAYATAALLLIAVSIGVWTLQPGNGLTPQMVAEDIPDLYEDLDFYLWLADQNGNGSEDEDTDPDKT